MQKGVKINFRLSDELYKALDKKASELELPKGYVIRQALKEYLGAHTSDELPKKVSSTPAKKKAPKSSSSEAQRDWSNVVQSYWKDKKKA